jgi:carbonic anhydrase
MNIEDLTFGIKDVVAIIVAIISGAGFVYAIKNQADKNKTRMNSLDLAQDELQSDTEKSLVTMKTDMDEKFLHAKNAKKANIMAIYEEINRNREEFKEKETQIYIKIEDSRKEQKDSHEKMSVKLDTLGTQMNLISTNLAELTGYIRAKKEE